MCQGFFIGKSVTANAENNISLAVLIDADNASPKVIQGLLTEVAKLGNASVKRIYGDWTTPELASWKSVLLEYAIQPIQQFCYTSGKNSTDSAMIIDAMDMLYTGPFQGFCIVSSDSDFTRLASRIKESGKRVFGFGEKKTPKPFVVACDQFIYTEGFCAPALEAPETKQKTIKDLRNDPGLINLFRCAIRSASDETGWANLSGVGSYIVKEATDFNPKKYGYQKLSDLASATGLFEISKVKKCVRIKDGMHKKREAAM